MNIEDRVVDLFQTERALTFEKKIPKVSIGMPVYNGVPFIREALDSLLNQTFTDFELIISDNASTDGTESICREYVAKDARVRYVQQAENLGANANFQFVLDQAVGQYFMWAAADDLQKPTFIEKLVNIMDKNKELSCVMSDVENIYEDSSQTTEISILNDIRYEIACRAWIKHRKRFFRNPTSNIFFCIYGVFRTVILKQIQLNYRGMVKYASASEIPLLAQLAIMGPICSVSEPLKIYRRHSESLFHTEQSRIDFSDLLYGFINVSYVLTQIIRDSSLPLIEKIGLYVAVIRSGLKGFILLLLRLAIRWARNLWNTKRP
jgi:glycosyltransferase involved in cell wall biosynthesis